MPLDNDVITLGLQRGFATGLRSVGSIMAPSRRPIGLVTVREVARIEPLLDHPYGSSLDW
jgi:hypothetical protein